ncbi:MAG: sigma-70 family RNA polymerase sigma factor [Pirellulales bacterium]
MHHDTEPLASDGSLLRRVQSGEQDAATELYARYAARLRGLARTWIGDDLQPRFDADDVLQSVFRTFFRRAAAGQYQVPEGEELWSLLLVIALNKLRGLAAHHRAAKRSVRSTAAFELAEGRTDPTEEEAGQILRLLVAELLEELPPASARLVELRITGHSVDEIAAATERSKRTVERVLQSFRARLQELIHAAP